MTVIYTRGDSSGYKNGLRDGIEKVCIKIENQAKLLTPVDTGTLRQSISHYMASDEEGIVGTGTTYAPYIEFGTKSNAAQPFLRPAVYVAANAGAAKLVADELNLEMRKTLKKKKRTTL